MTEKRFEKIKSVVYARQRDLTIVLENIHDPHNVSAILRTADSVGIDEIYLIYNTNIFPKMGKRSSASARKWIDLKKFNNVEDCFNVLKEKGFNIYSTFISDIGNDKTLYDLDLTNRIAIVLGNEHTGISKEAQKFSDQNFKIPMYGMIQSLNVSVAAAVCLYEALRQRELKGMYKKSLYSEKELEQKMNYYLEK